MTQEIDMHWKFCFLCGRKKAEHEFFSIQGVYYGDYCSNCYEQVNKEYELYQYHGAPKPEWMNQSFQERKDEHLQMIEQEIKNNPYQYRWCCRKNISVRIDYLKLEEFGCWFCPYNILTKAKGNKLFGICDPI